MKNRKIRFFKIVSTLEVKYITCEYIILAGISDGRGIIILSHQPLETVFWELGGLGLFSPIKWNIVAVLQQH